MTVCQFLHDELRKLPRFHAGYNPQDIPRNGLYFLFERDAFAHGGERIVRVGTHTGDGNLPKRLKEHLYTKNKDRSVFRKHIGRSILAQRNDPFLEMWEIDLTTRKAREEHSSKIDMQRLAEVEQEVSDYMNINFSFVVLKVEDKTARLTAEAGLLSAIAACTDCCACSKWLGLHHSNPAIRESGLWNIQGLNDTPITLEDAKTLLQQ